MPRMKCSLEIDWLPYYLCSGKGIWAKHLEEICHSLKTQAVKVLEKESVDSPIAPSTVSSSSSMNDSTLFQHGDGSVSSKTLNSSRRHQATAGSSKTDGREDSSKRKATKGSHDTTYHCSNVCPHCFKSFANSWSVPRHVTVSFTTFIASIWNILEINDVISFLTLVYIVRKGRSWCGGLISLSIVLFSLQK